MSVAPSSDNVEPDHRHLTVSWLLLAGLLILRLPFLGSLALFPSSIQPWIDATYEAGSYFLTACLIWWERKHWADFHLDSLAVVLIVVFKPIATLLLAWTIAIAPELAPHGPYPLAVPRPLGLSIWLVAIGLVIALRWDGIEISHITKKLVGWFIVGLAIGLATAVLIAYPLSLQITKADFVDNQVPTQQAGIAQWLAKAIYAFIYQLGMAAVSEEPLFRGFLWGHLRKLHWRETWIWLFQAGLFSLAHIYYLSGYAISFWFIVPVGGLVTGWVAWRSRSIAASMATHGAMNAWGRILAERLAFH